MLTIRLSGGYTETITHPLQDESGAALTGATVFGCLVTERTPAPPAGSDAWQPTDTDITGSGALVSLILNEENTTPGHKWLWFRVGSSPTLAAVQALEEDGRPVLILIT